MFAVSDLLRDFHKIALKLTPFIPPSAHTELGLSCFPIGDVNEILTSVTIFCLQQADIAKNLKKIPLSR
jgi:hypothetical protein